MNRYIVGIYLSLLAGNLGIRAEDAPKPTYLRVVHAVYDATPIDIYLNNKLIISNSAFKTITDYKMLKPGTYNLKVTPAGKTEAIFERKLTSLKANNSYTVVAGGALSDIKPYIFSSQLLSADYAKAKVNVFHFSPDAPPMDMWLGLEAANIKKKRVIKNLEFTKKKSYTTMPINSMLQVMPNNQIEPVFSKIDVQFKAGKSYSIFAFNSFKAGKLEFISVEDKFETEDNQK